MKYNFESLKAFSKFFSYRNDVDIFTEDKTSDKEFYKSLFKNLFGDTLKINDITPLGCKENVLKAYDNRDMNTTKKQYFIVDGDLELVINDNRQDTKKLIILDSYCIENYLICEKGMIELMYYTDGKESKSHHKTNLNFDKWLNKNICLVELFINFGILRKYNGAPKIRNANEFMITKSKNRKLDTSKISLYLTEIKKEIIQILIHDGHTKSKSEVIYQNEYNILKKSWKINNNSLLKIVSGKDYLLPLLQFRVNSCKNNNSLIPKDSIKLFLAKNSNLNRLKFLKSRIKN